MHAKSISLHNGFCEMHAWRLVSWKALREHNDLWALLGYPVFEDEKSNGPKDQQD